MAAQKTIFFKKLIDGGVLLLLQDSEGVLPDKWFNMDHRTPRIGVPLNYALSVFQNQTIESMLKSNYFEIENINDLLGTAEEKSIVALSEEENKIIAAPKRTNELIVSILRGGNETKIKELFDSADRQRAFDLALQHASEFSISTVDKVEKILGMAILERDE